MEQSNHSHQRQRGQQMIEYILISMVVVVVVIYFISKTGKDSYRETFNSNLNAIGILMKAKQDQIR